MFRFIHTNPHKQRYSISHPNACDDAQAQVVMFYAASQRASTRPFLVYTLVLHQIFRYCVSVRLFIPAWYRNNL